MRQSPAIVVLFRTSHRLSGALDAAAFTFLPDLNETILNYLLARQNQSSVYRSQCRALTMPIIAWCIQELHLYLRGIQVSNRREPLGIGKVCGPCCEEYSDLQLSVERLAFPTCSREPASSPIGLGESLSMKKVYNLCCEEYNHLQVQKVWLGSKMGMVGYC